MQPAPPTDEPSRPRPLDGVKVLELGQLIAGPFAGTMLAYFGAEVVKFEPLAGDPIRTWRGMDGDTSVWWRSLSRNKRCVALDLHAEAGQALARRLALDSDVVVENFRPGTLERWGLGPEALLESKPSLVIARVSGFGQTGPYRERAGFAAVCEAMSGLRHITGTPGEPPVRSNLSLGDTLGGLHGVIGILLALLHRDRTGQGQIVDVALTESVLNVMESVLPEVRALGIVRQPSGGALTGVVPSNAYLCKDGRSVVIGANTDRLFAALMRVAGREDLASDPALASNPGRVEQVERIDAAIASWTGSRASDEVVLALSAAGIPAGPIYDAAAVAADPHFQERGLWEVATAEGRAFELPALAPKLTTTPGRTEWAGPALGAHTDEVLRERLGLDAAAILELRGRGVIR